MEKPNSQKLHGNLNLPSIWSVDRIGRLIVGILNLLLLLAVFSFSYYFLIGIGLINLNLIFTSITDKCPMRKLLIKLGAKEREKYFNSKGELIQSKESRRLEVELAESKSF
jgi:hypothetical protein